jgi:hypothetical protein
MMFSNLPDENVSDHPPFLIRLASHTNHGAPHQFLLSELVREIVMTPKARANEERAFGGVAP